MLTFELIMPGLNWQATETESAHEVELIIFFLLCRHKKSGTSNTPRLFQYETHPAFLMHFYWAAGEVMSRVGLLRI